MTSPAATSLRGSGRAGLLFAALLLAGCGASPPSSRIDRLVPADALVYVHVSTDPGRAQDRRLVAAARRLPALAPLLRAYDGIRPWLGKEAGFFVTPQGEAVILSVRDPKAAAAALPRLRGLGEVAPAAGFYVAGTPAAVERSVALARREARPLPAHAAPQDRVLDAYLAPGAGVLMPEKLRRLAGRPVTASLRMVPGGVRLTATRRGGAGGPSFRPRLLRALPVDTFAYAGARGLDRLPGLPDVIAPLARVADGEVALAISPGLTQPIVTLIAQVSDPARARETLASLQGKVAAALTGSGLETGQVPVFDERSVAGHDGYALRLSGGGELVYAVVGGRIVVSTSEDGVARALRDADGLDTAPAFGSALPEIPESVQALAFVASSQLLELADGSGLDAAAVYRMLRPNLARIRALGAVVRRQGTDTIAELTLLIP